MRFIPYGIIPPIVTPVTEEGKFNESMMRKVVNYLIAQGVHGLFPLGTTGEFYAFDHGEYRYILETVVDEVKGRVPVYGGATHITTREMLAQVKIAQETGVDALSVLTPMFTSQTQQELYGFYKAVSENTSLPIIIYNNRPKTNVTVTPETAARLAQLDNIVGIKDSTGDFTNTLEYIRLTKGMDFHVLLGKDTLIFAGLCCGACGAIASCANVAPRLLADIYDKFQAGDREGALEAQMRFFPLHAACNQGTFPQGIKEGMILQGMEVGKCFDPICELLPEEKQVLREALSELGLSVVK